MVVETASHQGQWICRQWSEKVVLQKASLTNLFFSTWMTLVPCNLLLRKLSSSWDWMKETHKFILRYIKHQVKNFLLIWGTPSCPTLGHDIGRHVCLVENHSGPFIPWSSKVGLAWGTNGAKLEHEPGRTIFVRLSIGSQPTWSDRIENTILHATWYKSDVVSTWVAQRNLQ